MIDYADPIGSPSSQGSNEIISISSDADDATVGVLEFENNLSSVDTLPISQISRKRKRQPNSPQIKSSYSRAGFAPDKDLASGIGEQDLLDPGRISIAERGLLGIASANAVLLESPAASGVDASLKHCQAGSPGTKQSERCNQHASIELVADGPETDQDIRADDFEIWDPYDETLEIFSIAGRSQVASQRESATVTRLLQDAEYLAKRGRSGLRSTPWEPWLPSYLRRLLPYKFGTGRVLSAGQAIHVEFSYEEMFRLKTIYDENKSDNIPPSQMATWLSIQFPGRQPEDVAAFIRENDLTSNEGRLVFSRKLESFQYPGVGDSIIAATHTQKQRNIDGLANRLLTRALYPNFVLRQDLSNQYPVLLKPHKSYLGTSGDVNTIEFSPDGGHVVIGCAATDDEYNRSGNLTLISTGIRNNISPRSLVLDGKNLYRNKFSTISAAKFVKDGRFLIVGGADETLKLYSAKGRFMHDMSRKNRLCTHDIATSPQFPDIAASCHDTGDLDLHHFSTDGRVITQAIEKHDSLAPAVVVFNDVHRRLIAGYESKHSQPCSGEATIYDLETRVKLETIGGSESYAHIAISSTGQWIAGTNSLTSGTVTVYDPRERISRPIYKFYTSQRDINEVSIFDDYVTSSATDGTCQVWDVRAAPSPLHVLQHGAPKQVSGTDDICGITGSAFFSSASFITGSSDGCVKLWNLGLAQPFMRNMIEVDSPVTRLALSAQKDQLVIGENRGAVQLWSIHGSGVATPMAEDRSLVQET